MLGSDFKRLDLIEKRFNPAEPRDKQGRWSVIGGIEHMLERASNRQIEAYTVKGRSTTLGWVSKNDVGSWEYAPTNGGWSGRHASRTDAVKALIQHHKSRVKKVHVTDAEMPPLPSRKRKRPAALQDAMTPDVLNAVQAGVSKDEIEKHGTKGRPGYRLLHPGVGTGFSHRFESRGLSQKYARARHENLKPRPKSGLGRGGGKFKSFMERDRRKLGSAEVSADVRRRLSPDQKKAHAAYVRSKKKYETYGKQILAADTPTKMNAVVRLYNADKDLIPEHRTALTEAVKAERKKKGFNEPGAPAKRAAKKAAAPAKKVASAKPADNKDILAADIHRRIDAAQNTAHLERIVDAIDQHGQKRELRVKHIDSLLDHVAERHVQHREERLGIKRPASLPEVKVAAGHTALGNAARAVVAAQAKQAAARKRPSSVKPKTPDSAPAVSGSGLTAGNVQRNVVAVDVARDFTDVKAMEAFLDNGEDPLGRKFFEKGRGDIIYISDSKDAAAEKFIQLAEARGIKVVRHPYNSANAAEGHLALLARADRKIENKRGYGHVVAFRNAGQTIVDDPHDLLNAHLRRGKDTKGNPAEALVIGNGYRAVKDASGAEVDSHAFGVASQDLPRHLKAKPRGSMDKLRQAILQNKLGVGKTGLSRVADPNPDNSPAGKELAKGKTIDQLKSNDGMLDYVRAHPERFEIKSINAGQVSDAFTIIDKSNGKKFFIKRANNGGRIMMDGDGMNEVMAAALGRAAFTDLFPHVEFAEDPGGVRHPHIRMDHLDDFVPGAQKVEYAGNGMLAGRELKDPRNALAIHLFDFLINQKDRHAGNYGNVQTPGGRVIVPLDNGAAFHGFGRYILGAVPEIDSDVAYAPEKMSYKQWVGLFAKGEGIRDIFTKRWLASKASRMLDEARLAYHHKGWGRDKLAADAEAIIKKFKAVNVKAIVTAIKAEYPNLDEYELKHLEAAVMIWEARIKQLTAVDTNEIVKAVGL